MLSDELNVEPGYLCCFQLMTARAVAEQLDVSPETVLRWTRRGELPAIKLPSGQVRYDEDQIEAWVKERAMPRSGVLTATDDIAQAGILEDANRH